MPLSPSQRVTLIKEISARLVTEDYALIDVTLKQFSLPWSNEWPGDKTSYVIEMISDAADQVLVDLAQHVGFPFEVASPLRIDPPFWRKGMLRLFLSHLAAHQAYAAELQTALLGFGVSGFVAHNDIEPTAEWQTQIETALATCDALIALLHPEFQDSKWTDQEVGFAMGRGVPTFAVRLGQVPYGFIGRFQAFDGGGNKTAAVLAREIFDAFRLNKQTSQRMAQIIVGIFEESSSFAEAKTRVGYLEELQSWESSFSTRIRSAARSNSQISGAFGVPARVETLLQKWSKSGL